MGFADIATLPLQDLSLTSKKISGRRFMDYACRQQMLVCAFFSANAVVPTPPNQTNERAFRGIERARNDIYAFRIRGAFAVLDDLSFSRAFVPIIDEDRLGKEWKKMRPGHA